MIYKKDLLNHIEVIETKIEELDKNKIEKLNETISAIIEYLGCKIKVIKTIEQNGYDAIGYDGKLRHFNVGNEYIKHTKKLVKKSKK